MVITSISLTEKYPINIENRYDLLFVSGQYYVIISLNLRPVTSKQKNGFDSTCVRQMSCFVLAASYTVKSMHTWGSIPGLQCGRHDS